MRLIRFPNPILNRTSEPVTEFDDDLLSLLEEMEQVMHEENGAGLAAIQIGTPKCVVLVVLRKGEEKRLLKMVNPRVLDNNAVREIQEEGCLSYPDLWIDIERLNGVLVGWDDEEGTHQEEWFYGWDARAVQHEIDHLSGKTVYARANRKLRKRWEKREVKKNEKGKTKRRRKK